MSYYNYSANDGIAFAEGKTPGSVIWVVVLEVLTIEQKNNESL